jgi:hypothetical protein
MGSDMPEWGKADEMTEKDRHRENQENATIPGEVTSRRKHKVSKDETKKATEEYITLSWDDVFPKKPKERLRWLDKALRAAKDGRVKSLPVFDIIVHRKFLEGLKGQIATDSLNLIRGYIDVFSAKQRKQLTSDNFELFRKYAPISVLDSDDDEADAPPLPPPPKVIIEEKGKKKKKGGGGADEERRRREREEDSGDTEDELETKRIKLLSRGIERRVDPRDKQAYTLTDFIAEYGGSSDRPPEEWHAQRHTSFVFKA